MADYRFYLDRLLTKKKQQIEFIEGNVIQTPGITGALVDAPKLSQSVWTVEFWIKLDRVDAIQFLFTERQTSSSSTWNYYIAYVPSFQSYLMEYYNSSGENMGVVELSNVIIANTWYHIAISFDNINQKINSWLNGELFLNNLNMPAPMNQALGVTRFFRFSYLNLHPMYGKFTDLRVWNHVRTTTQIQANRCIRLKGNESGLIRYYKFDEIINTNIIEDKSTNGLDATVTRPDLFSFVDEPKLCS